MQFINVFKIKLDKAFDTIWLSNIGTYGSRHFLKIMVDNMSSYLKEEGKLLMCYLYRTNINTKYEEDWSPVYNSEKTFQILMEYTPELLSFEGVDGIKFKDNQIKDSALIYTKRKS